MEKAISTIEKGLDTFCKAIVLVCVVVLIAAGSAQVFFRYVLNHSLSWTDELCRYAQVWLMFFGSAYVLHTKGHIAMDLLQQKVPVPVKEAINKLTDILGLLLGVVLTVYGYRLAASNYSQLSTGLNIPMAYVYMGVPVAGVIMSLYALLGVFRRPNSESQKEG